MPQLPEGGYDTKLTYYRIEIQPPDIRTIGRFPTSFRTTRVERRPLLVPTHEETVTPVPSMEEQDLLYGVTTLYAHKVAYTLWHSDRVVVDEITPKITDYGWKIIYITVVWTTNEEEAEEKEI